MSGGSGYSLEVPAAAEMATTVRVFAAGSARAMGSEEQQIEEVRLITTELLANTIETGGTQLFLTLSSDQGGWRIEAHGAGSLVTGTAEHSVDRRALISSFASIRETEDGLELRALSPDGDR